MTAAAKTPTACESASAPAPPIRLGILASHPIQYQAPLYRALAAKPEIELHVFFCSRWGSEEYSDPGFGVRFSWDTPVLAGYNYTFLGNYGLGRGPGRVLNLVNPGMLPRIARRDIDVLLVHGWASATNWLAWAGAAALRLPLLMRGESDGLHERSGIAGAFRRKLLRAMFRNIPAFLAIGSLNRSFYLSHGVPGDRIFVTPYAVDNHFFFQTADKFQSHKRELRARERIEPDSSLILFSGKLVAKKRPMDLLRVFAALGRGHNAALAFVGDGALRAEMERFVAQAKLERVHFLGFRNQSEIGSVYAMADVLALPSDYETWGLVVNEAMCFGLPIVASGRVGAAADLVRHGENGFVYPAGDVHALARHLATLIASGESRERMGRRSREIIAGWGIDESAEGIVRAAQYAAGRGADGARPI